ncbi:MAG TPA: hypothetical protein VMZ31_14245 [Phycisphaerae bacterium]|nr:hypothetical protein [Phycisphaerae bacterium]
MKKSRRVRPNRGKPCAAVVILLLLGATVVAQQEQSEPQPDYMRPTERGLRLTPGIARAIGTLCAGDPLKRQYGLDEEAQEKAAELIARRLMQTAHENQEQGQAFFEFAFESVIESQGRFTPELGKRWAELSVPLVAPMRECWLGVVEDLRPLIPPEKQARYAADTIAATLFFDGYTKKMARWKEGNVGRREDPFNVHHEPKQQDDPEQQAAASAPSEPDELAEARRTGERMLDYQMTRRWRQYVNEAVSYYQFDEAQQETAESILAELSDRAGQITTDDWRAKALLNRIKWQLGHREMGLYNTPWTWQVDREFDDLMHPIHEMTRQLQRRLDAIPTAAQRAAAEKPITERFNKLGLSE